MTKQILWHLFFNVKQWLNIMLYVAGINIIYYVFGVKQMI